MRAFGWLHRQTAHSLGDSRLSETVAAGATAADQLKKPPVWETASKTQKFR